MIEKRARYEVTLEEANEFCHHHAMVRHAEPCRSCMQLHPDMAFDYAMFQGFMFPGTPRPENPESLTAALDRLLDHGWERSPTSNSYVLRCVPCRVPEYPWVAKLDRERVRDWMQKLYDASNGGAFFIDWDDLRRSCG